MIFNRKSNNGNQAGMANNATPEQLRMFAELCEELGVDPLREALFRLKATNPSLGLVRTLGGVQVTADMINVEATTTAGTGHIMPGIPRPDPSRYAAGVVWESKTARGDLAATPNPRMGVDNTYIAQWFPAGQSMSSYVKGRSARPGTIDDQIIAGAFPTAGVVVLSPNAAAAVDGVFQYMLIDFTVPSPAGGVGKRTVSFDFSCTMVDPESKQSLGAYTMPVQSFDVIDGASYRFRITPVIQDATGMLCPVFFYAGLTNPVVSNFTGPGTTDVAASLSVIGDGVLLIGDGGEVIR